MEQLSQEVAGFYRLARIEALIHLSSLSLESLSEELLALFTQKSQLSEIAEIPPEQLYTLLDSLIVQGQLLANLASSASPVLGKLKYDVYTIQQGAQDMESGE